MGVFETLKVWQQSHKLVLALYKITKSFPDEERFGLVSQIRRAGVSVAANIAEGSQRQSDKDFAHFLYISKASLEEVKYYLHLSRDLCYINDSQYAFLDSLSDEIGKLLYGFIKRLKM